MVIFSLYSPAKHKLNQFFIGALSGPSKVLSLSGTKTRNFFSFARNISHLKKENDELAEKLIKMQVDTSKINELENENELLKKELGFLEKNKEFSLLPATIIGREPTSFLDHVVLDKGERDGVMKGSGVISGGVLIGQVIEIYPNQSKVTLITSKDSMIMAMLQGSRSKGILRGGISGLVLENIVQDINFEPGEYVVTSGLDGELKPGILIGRTTNVQTSSSDLFKNISVEPIADLSKLELVFIIK